MWTASRTIPDGEKCLRCRERRTRPEVDAGETIGIRDQSAYSFAGIKVHVRPNMPEGMIGFVLDGKLVGGIVNAGPERES